LTYLYKPVPYCIKMGPKSGGQFLLLYRVGEIRMNKYEALMDRYSQRKNPSTHIKKMSICCFVITNYTRTGLGLNLGFHLEGQLVKALPCHCS